MENAPIVIHQHVEYHSHIDTTEILQRLRRIERKVEQDTAAEETLSAQNEELREQLESLLTGETLPPAVAEKIAGLVTKIKSNTAILKKAVTDNTPVPTPGA